MRVGSLMSGNVKTIAPDRTLRDAARVMRLIGIVSLGDLAKASLPDSAEALHAVSQPVGSHNRGQAR
jgi:CBS domain-containing protein